MYFPDARLHHLYDNLPLPERFQYIVYPASAWAYLSAEYEFDRYRTANAGLFYRQIDMTRRLLNSFSTPAGHSPSAGRLFDMLHRGEAVFINDEKGYWESTLHPFYIDETGALKCNDPTAFSFNGAKQIIDYYESAVGSCFHHAGRPRPTQRDIQRGIEGSSTGLSTLNSKNVGRLLAAGGVINQNVDGFAQTARQLGGEASDGFEQVYNPQTVGSLIALSALVGFKRMESAAELEKLKNYLGSYKKQPNLLKNVDVVKMTYKRRPIAERQFLRQEFKNKVRKNFIKSLANHPEILKRGFTPDDLARMKRGSVPDNWSVHHKLPLDDSGSNDFNNLVLIRNNPEHAMFTTAQKRISQNIKYGESQEVLWVLPQGLVYP